VARAATPHAQLDAVTVPWHNCANARFRRRLGDYPMAARRRFLAAWRITEHVIGVAPGQTDRR
jgi:hypothetical protein